MRKKLFLIIEVGNNHDAISRMYDYINAMTIIINLIVSIMYTFEGPRIQYGELLLMIRHTTVAFFALDYFLRLFTAKYLYPDRSESKAIWGYVRSFTGIVDLLSFLPYYFPGVVPAGLVAFRMLRLIRIFRLFQINSYYDSLHVITEVIRGKQQQLISSVFLIAVLMIASSLCMYSLEHEAQPDVFENAFSGIWWATSTLLTVGYGDIYPITTLGRIFGILTAFLGVGMVAVPTGIISAGFVEQYSSIKKRAEYGREAEMNFIKINVEANDSWAGKKVSNLGLPADVIMALIKREEKILIPKADMEIQAGDTIILGAEPFDTHENEEIHLKEIVIEKYNPWTGLKIGELDISRHSIVVLVKRGEDKLIPREDMILMEGDCVFLCTKLHYANANDIYIY